MFVLFAMVFGMATKRIAITSSLGIGLGAILFVAGWIAYGENLMGFLEAMFTTICSVALIGVYSYMWIAEEIKKEYKNIP